MDIVLSGKREPKPSASQQLSLLVAGSGSSLVPRNLQYCTHKNKPCSTSEAEPSTRLKASGVLSRQGTPLEEEVALLSLL